MIPQSDKEWWGFSQIHGWVLVNWEHAKNNPEYWNDQRNNPKFESPRRLYLIRCKDWVEISILLQEWSPPGYTSAPEWIDSLSSPARQAALEQLEAFQTRFYFGNAQRRDLLSRLQEEFETDFLNAEAFYEHHCSSCISPTEFADEKAMFVQRWAEATIRHRLDSQQAAAIAALHGHVQVVARAGSGKTSTLVTRACCSVWSGRLP